jgi:hypothetical protein
MTPTTIETFVTTCNFQSGYCRLMQRDYAEHGRKEPLRFAKRILAHNYGWLPAKQLRDLLRVELGFGEEAA